MPAVIGIDIGTTSTIGILIDLPGRIVGIVSKPTDLISLHPGWAEENPEQWWHNSCSVIRELLALEPDLATSLVGVGVAGMVPAIVLLDEEDNLLRRSIQQSDGRSTQQVSEINAEIDSVDFLARTGNGVSQQIVATKLRWIKRHEPEIFAHIGTCFGSYDYINWRLTGEKRIEHNWALESGFFDLKQNKITPELIALADIPQTALPPIAKSHEIIGRVTAAAALQSGLPEGLPVVAGTADHVASAYAAGVVQAGDVLLKFGGAGDILISVDDVVPDHRIFLDHHVIPGRFMPNGCMAATGAMLNWLVSGFVSGLAAESDKPHTFLDDKASAIPAGSEGVFVLPYLLGEKSPIQNPDARGVIAGLSLNHSQAHLWRAALEGVGYAFKHHLEVFRELGYPVRRLLVSDGGAKSHVWMQIVADILQQPLQQLEGHPGSCLGSAWVAAMGVGASQEWGAVTTLLRQGKVIQPNPRNKVVYEAGYEKFRLLYEDLVPWFSKS